MRSVSQSHHISVTAVGHALAKAKRTLVYGGGSEGVMGLVSGAVLEGGGKVVGIIPYAMVSAGGEGRNESDIPSSLPQLSEIGRENVCTPRFFFPHA
jgi:predicted Rossmann-fold nucleotide-binding protein